MYGVDATLPKEHVFELSKTIITHERKVQRIIRTALVISLLCAAIGVFFTARNFHTHSIPTVIINGLIVFVVLIIGVSFYTRVEKTPFENYVLLHCNTRKIMDEIDFAEALSKDVVFRDIVIYGIPQYRYLLVTFKHMKDAAAYRMCRS